MKKISTLLSFVFIAVLFSCNNTSKTKTTKPNQSASSPTEFKITLTEQCDWCDRPLIDDVEESFFEFLHGAEYNPNGYRMYFPTRSTDEYGNTLDEEYYYGGIIYVSKSFYDEVQKFTSAYRIYDDRYKNDKTIQLFKAFFKCVGNDDFYEQLLDCEISFSGISEQKNIIPTKAPKRTQNFKATEENQTFFGYHQITDKEYTFIVSENKWALYNGGKYDLQEEIVESGIIIGNAIYDKTGSLKRANFLTPTYFLIKDKDGTIAFSHASNFED